MRFKLWTPEDGFVAVEVKPAGSRYQWSCNALGQHGDGTIDADSIDHAHDVVRGIVRARLQRKYIYERSRP